MAIKLFSSDPKIKELTEIAQEANNLGNEYLDLIKEFQTSQTPEARTILLNRMDAINKKMEKVPQSFSIGVNKLSEWGLSLTIRIMLSFFIFLVA